MKLDTGKGLLYGGNVRFGVSYLIPLVNSTNDSNMLPENEMNLRFKKLLKQFGIRNTNHHRLQD